MELFVFLIFLYDIFLEYRDATDLWILILYPSILLNLFISSNSFMGESLGFSIYNIVSLAKSDSVTPSFPI